MLYGRGYYTPTKKRASYRVNIIIRNSESRAEFEYNRNIMLLDKIHKSYLVTIDPKLYKADKIFCIEKTDYFYLVIKRKLYVYIVTLDNIPAHEGDIRSILQIKLNNLDESLRLGQST